jgi:hypothetical protein
MKNIFSFSSAFLSKIVFTILFTIAFFWCALIAFSSASFAAGKGYVKIGEKFSAELDDVPRSASVQWVLTSEGEILETLQEKKFSYTFQKSGLYTLRGTIENTDKTKKTTVYQLEAVASIPSFEPLTARMQTLPVLQGKTVFLAGDTGEKDSVVFSFNDSSGDIVRYELDPNIFGDEDENGIIDDDIVNKKDASFRIGGSFIWHYTNDGLPMRARLRVYDEKGEVSESYINIRFLADNSSVIERSEKNTNIVLDTLPQVSSDGNIWIEGEKGTVMLFSGYSEGKIKEYQIDTDVLVDSDGDGNAENDIDNKNTSSYEKGDAFLFEVTKKADSSAPQQFQVTIVDESGKTSTERKTILFKDSTSASGASFLQPVLFPSRSQIKAQESVIFQIFSIPENAKISWDFDGDGIFEIKEGTDEKVEYQFSTPGEFLVHAHIIEVGKDPVVLEKTIKVGEGESVIFETSDPKAHFSVEVSDNKAMFLSSKSSADPNLLNTDITYLWDFGDGFKASGPNPSHIYEKVGKYQVVLLVEDALERTGSFTAEVEVLKTSFEFSQDQHGGSSYQLADGEEVTIDTSNAIEVNPEDLTDEQEQTPESSPVPSLPIGEGFNFSWIFWMVLIVLFSPLLLVLKKKVDEPDKDFSTLFTELFSGKKSSQKNDDEDQDQDTTFLDNSDSVSVDTAETNNTYDSSDASSLSPFSDGVLSDDDSEEKTEEATPDWMKSYDEEQEKQNTEVLENVENTENISENIASPELPENTGETDSFLSEEETEKTPEENGNIENTENADTVPDWLKGADSPLDDDLPDDENTSGESLHESPFSNFNHPDWLEDIKDEDSEQAEQTEEVEELWVSEENEEEENAADISPVGEDDEDFYKNEEGEEDKEGFENKPEEDDEVEIPDWLKSDVDEEESFENTLENTRKNDEEDEDDEDLEADFSLENTEENNYENNYEDDEDDEVLNISPVPENYEEEENTEGSESPEIFETSENYEYSEENDENDENARGEDDRRYEEDELEKNEEYDEKKYEEDDEVEIPDWLKSPDEDADDEDKVLENTSEENTEIDEENLEAEFSLENKNEDESTELLEKSEEEEQEEEEKLEEIPEKNILEEAEEEIQEQEESDFPDWLTSDEDQVLQNVEEEVVEEKNPENNLLDDNENMKADFSLEDKPENKSEELDNAFETHNVYKTVAEEKFLEKSPEHIEESAENAEIDESFENDEIQNDETEIENYEEEEKENAETDNTDNNVENNTAENVKSSEETLAEFLSEDEPTNPFSPEEEIIAKNAKIPRQERSNAVPQWLQ